jgi:hypothetical protein
MPGRFDLDVTTIGELLDDPQARAVIDQIVPELPDHPMVGMVKGMAGGRLPADKVAELTSRISAL